MEITFCLPNVFSPESNQAENAETLRALLDCLIRCNLAYLRRYAVRPLYRSGVVYGRTEIWDTIPALYQRGYGDCKSLSAALIAEYLQQGIPAKPEFRFLPPDEYSPSYRFHILVFSTKYGWEDPSKKLGMPHE